MKRKCWEFLLLAAICAVAFGLAPNNMRRAFAQDVTRIRTEIRQELRRLNLIDASGSSALGTLATQNANNVSISGGAITGTTATVSSLTVSTGSDINNTRTVWGASAGSPDLGLERIATGRARWNNGTVPQSFGVVEGTFCPRRQFGSLSGVALTASGVYWRFAIQDIVECRAFVGLASTTTPADPVTADDAASLRYCGLLFSTTAADNLHWQFVDDNDTTNTLTSTGETAAVGTILMLEIDLTNVASFTMKLYNGNTYTVLATKTVTSTPFTASTGMNMIAAIRNLGSTDAKGLSNYLATVELAQ